MRVEVLIKDEARVVKGLLALCDAHPDSWSGAFGGIPVPARLERWQNEAKMDLQKFGHMIMAPFEGSQWDASYPRIYALTGDDSQEWGWESCHYDAEDGAGGRMGLRFEAGRGWVMRYHGSRHSLHQSGVSTLYLGLGGDHWARNHAADPLVHKSRVNAPWWIPGVLEGVEYEEEYWWVHGENVPIDVHGVKGHVTAPTGLRAIVEGLGVQHLDMATDFSLHRKYWRPTEPEPIRLPGETPSFRYFSMYPVEWGWQIVLTVATPWPVKEFAAPYDKIRAIMEDIGAEPELAPCDYGH